MVINIGRAECTCQGQWVWDGAELFWSWVENSLKSHWRVGVELWAMCIRNNTKHKDKLNMHARERVTRAVEEGQYSKVQWNTWHATIRRHILLSTSSLTILLKCLQNPYGEFVTARENRNAHKRRTTGSGILGISHRTSFLRDSRVVMDPLNLGSSELNVILVQVPCSGSGGGFGLCISLLVSVLCYQSHLGVAN